MTKRRDPADILIGRYNRSTGNFADNLREMDVQDIASQYAMTNEQAQRVYDHIRLEQMYLEQMYKMGVREI